MPCPVHYDRKATSGHSPAQKTGNLSKTKRFSEALPVLTSFARRQARPTPWKCALEIGERLKVPVALYVKTKENRMPSKWQRYDATSDANAVVGVNYSNALSPFFTFL